MLELLGGTGPMICVGPAVASAEYSTPNGEARRIEPREGEVAVMVSPGDAGALCVWWVGTLGEVCAEIRKPSDATKTRWSWSWGRDLPHPSLADEVMDEVSPIIVHVDHFDADGNPISAQTAINRDLRLRNALYLEPAAVCHHGVCAWRVINHKRRP